MDARITLWCLVDGNPGPTKVILLIGNDIDDLKDGIKSKERSLRDVDTSRIVIWKVDVSMALDPEETLAGRIQPDNHSKLSARTKLSTVFPLEPAEDNLHIYVTVVSEGSREPKRRKIESAEGSAIFDATKAHFLNLFPVADSANELWGSFWGKELLYLKGKVFKDDDDWEYDYLRNIRSIPKACGGSNLSMDVLVVLPEYINLRRYIEKLDRGAIVVTGHPGIGKTCFLLYLLLHRLEQKLSTSVQLNSDVVVTFSNLGATVHKVGGGMNLDFNDDHWALVDANASVTTGPCRELQHSGARVVLASSPQPDRWKEWIKQSYGITIIADLPSPLEIGAILHANMLDSVEGYSLINKWGPCTRTIIDILRHHNRQGAEAYYLRKAYKAADVVCTDPSSFRSLDEMPGSLHSKGSSIFFVCPVRELDKDSKSILESSASVNEIPTPFLATVFNHRRLHLSNQQSLDLFNALSTHAFTRSSDGWIFEQRIHAFLSSHHKTLDLFQGSRTTSIESSPNMIPGTVGALGNVATYPSFYWIPSRSNFPGIDSVLVNGKNIFAIQTTIADEHANPVAGLKEVWKNFDRSVRAEYAWHAVVISETQARADHLVAEFSKAVKSCTLGTEKKTVEIWSCAFSK